MSIESKAVKKAYDSPFYIYNKGVCDVWENYIIENKGEVEGAYSEWAININGDIPSSNFTFQIKKTSITSNSIFISSNKKIKEETILLFSKVSKFKENFIIREKSLLDKMGFSSYNVLNKNYSVQKQHALDELSFLLDHLNSDFESKSIKEVFYNKSTKQLQLTFNQLIEEPVIVEGLFAILK